MVISSDFHYIGNSYSKRISGYGESSRRENQFLLIPFRGDSGMCSRWDGTFVDDLDDENADIVVSLFEV